MAQSDNQKRIHQLHVAICKCTKCKGRVDKKSLCETCKSLDGLIDELRSAERKQKPKEDAVTAQA